MNYPNLISTAIADSDLKEIIGAINYIDDKLSNLLTISDLEQSALYKTKSDTVEFVLENLKLAEISPDLVPNNVDVKEIKKDVELIKSINQILKPLNALKKKLEDSKMVASSEAYLPSMAIYNANKANAIINKRAVNKSVDV